MNILPFLSTDFKYLMYLFPLKEVRILFKQLPPNERVFQIEDGVRNYFILSNGGFRMIFSSIFMY